jgi:hypothetical protein
MRTEILKCTFIVDRAQMGRALLIDASGSSLQTDWVLAVLAVVGLGEPWHQDHGDLAWNSSSTHQQGEFHPSSRSRASHVES